MKRAFTLIELLVVVAIMGLLGTASVGGYRQMQRGMEERGVMQNVNTFIRNAYNRAQIDRQPVEVYFWNETIRAKDEEGFDSEVVIGRAVAVRRQGRLSRMKGNMLIDEFGDYEQYDEDGNYAEAPKQDVTMRLYRVGKGDSLCYSIVKTVPRRASGVTEDYVTHDPRFDPVAAEDKDAGRLIHFGYEKEGDVGNPAWGVGAAYGFEFQSIDLPHNYLFGAKYSKQADSPVDGETKIVYRPDAAPSKNIEIYSLRPGSSGNIEAQKVASSDNPTRSMN